jgi:uncharacterized SAM-binding protein YcdF (DUF218 family)
MFALKKALSLLVEPVFATTLVLAVGVVLLWRGRRPRAGKVLVTIALGLLLLGGSSPLPKGLAANLEDRFQPLDAAAIAALAPAERPRFVVVLGPGHTFDRRLSSTARLSESGLARIVEGVRLYRAFAGSKLVVSGRLGEGVPHGEAMAAAAEELGVPHADIVVDTTALDTADEASALGQRVGAEPFALVTSAVHMPRAMGLFRKQGKEPIAAPTDYGALDPAPFHPGKLVPRTGGLTLLSGAIHEHVGIAWSRLRGQI